MPLKRTTTPVVEPAIIVRRWFVEIMVGFDLSFVEIGRKFELEEVVDGWLGV